MRDNRPVNLSVTQNLPFTAIASITHRISGVLLFVGVGFLLYLLQLALRSQAGFVEAQALMARNEWKFVVFAVLALLTFHLFAGVKHLLLDLHLGDTYPQARTGAITVTALTLVCVALTGAWLW